MVCRHLARNKNEQTGKSPNLKPTFQSLLGKVLILTSAQLRPPAVSDSRHGRRVSVAPMPLVSGAPRTGAKSHCGGPETLRSTPNPSRNRRQTRPWQADCYPLVRYPSLTPASGTCSLFNPPSDDTFGFFFLPSLQLLLALFFF